MICIPVLPGRIIPADKRNLLTSALTRKDTRYTVEFPRQSQNNAHFMVDIHLVLQTLHNGKEHTFKTNLVCESHDVQSDILTAIFGLHETFLEKTTLQDGQVFLMPHGLVFSGKSCQSVEDFEVRYFGKTHHDKIAFITDFKHALAHHSANVKNKFELEFSPHC